MVEILTSDKTLTPEEIDAELAAIALRYKQAGRYGVQMMNVLGAKAEGALGQLPPQARAALEQGLRQALLLSLRGAGHSRRLWPAQSPGWNRMVTAGLGAFGGAAGLAGALVELPLTTTVLLRSIQDVAAEHGFDPDAEAVRFDVLEVFSAAGPLDHDDGVETAFLTQRIGLAAGGLDVLVGLVAPRMAAAFGPKVAAQMLPVVGAVTGSSLNFAYTGYYQDMAHVHFGLRRLALEADQSHEAMVAQLRQRMLC